MNKQNYTTIQKSDQQCDRDTFDQPLTYHTIAISAFHLGSHHSTWYSQDILFGWQPTNAHQHFWRTLNTPMRHIHSKQGSSPKSRVVQGRTNRKLTAQLWYKDHYDRHVSASTTFWPIVSVWDDRPPFAVAGFIVLVTGSCLHLLLRKLRLYRMLSTITETVTIQEREMYKTKVSNWELLTTQLEIDASTTSSSVQKPSDHSQAPSRKHFATDTPLSLVTRNDRRLWVLIEWLAKSNMRRIATAWKALVKYQ